jgi:hypothetical protein
MICGNFISSDYNTFFVDDGQEYKANRAEQDKAEELAEP